MTKPILHSRTKTTLENYLHQPTHGLILAGAEGSGKYFVAQWLAKELEAPTFTIESPDQKSSITIEQIRELYNITRTGSNLVIIIKDAHELGREAQNAFLKLLEEPPKNTRFILTTKSQTALLPTIRSRSQSIEILPPSVVDLHSQTDIDVSGITELEKKSLLHTSKGLPGIFFQLLNNEELKAKHQQDVQEAKTFYSAPIYKRHIMCVEAKFEKVWIQDLLDILAIIIRSLTKQNTANQTMLKKLQQQAELIEQTSVNIFLINGNPKIHLAKLCEQL